MNKSSTNFAKIKKEVVEQHNIVRTNPKAYIPILEKQMTYFKGDVLNKPGLNYGIETQEGKIAYKECIDFLKKQKKCGELIFDEYISKASQGHADDIGPSGSCDHVGSDGSGLDERISKYLEWDVTICENIDFGAQSGEEILISLLVDDGVPDRGHRKNIFNPQLTHIGVGIANHAEYQVCTIIDYTGGIVSYKDKAQSKLGTKMPPNINININLSSKNNHKEHSKSIVNNSVSNNINVLRDAIVNRDKSLTIAKKPESKYDIVKEFNNKVNVSKALVNSKKVIVDNPFEDDPDAPENAVSVSTKITTKKAGGKTTKKTVKTYTCDDGSQEVVEIEEIES